MSPSKKAGHPFARFVTNYRAAIQTCLTVLLFVSFAIFAHKQSVDAWDLVQFCFLLATLLVAIPKDKGGALMRVGFALILSGILVIVGYGLFEASFSQLMVHENVIADALDAVGIGTIALAILLLAWAMARLIVESVLRFGDDA